MQPIQYKYNKFWSIFYTVLLSFLAVMPVSEMIEFKEFDTFALGFTFILELILLPPLIYVVIKGLIPALMGEIALEINSTGIVSRMKNTVIEWDNIEYIDVTGTNAMSLLIKFKWETGKRKSIRIPLQLVKGNAYDIYAEASYWLKNRNP